MPILKAIGTERVWLLRLVLNVETACGGHELGLYGMSCCEILLLLNMANMDRLLCRRVYIVQCSFSGCE